MKNTKIALITLALIASAGASATDLTPKFTGAVNSSVNGSTSSYSQANGVNKSSTHGSFAAAQNTATANADGYRGLLSSGATTNASTSGSTITGAGGIGQGGSFAGASQYGDANVTATVKAPILSASAPNTTATSGATVGTESTASNTNSGVALSGSNAAASNTSSVLVSRNLFGNSTSAVGSTVGSDRTNTWGGAIGNGSVTAGGTLLLNDGAIKNVGSVQNGSFSGNVKVTHGQ